MRKAMLAATALVALGLFPSGAIFADAVAAETVLEDLKVKLQGFNDENASIVATADGESRDLTDDETAKIEANAAEIEKIERQISAREIATRISGQGRRSNPENRSGSGSGGRDPVVARVNKGTGGFKNFGEFAQCVRAAGGDAPDQGAVQKLSAALTTYGNEGTGGDGGFIVPPDFRREIAVKVTGEETLLARTDRMLTSSNALVLPKDETTPGGGSGIQAYWESEAGQKQQSKPVFGQNSLRLNKLIALVPVTDELLEDAPAIDSYLRRKTPEVMNAKINDAILNGNGVGKPLGFLKSPALIVVTKESGQAADSILYANIVRMYARMRAASLPNSVWIANQSILPQLLTMAFDPAATAGKVPIYLPPTGAAGAPYGTLMGRPIVFTEAAAAVGDLGDLAFVDLTQYLTATKGQDIKTDISIHLFFDYDVTAYRFVFRVTGQPWWNAPITPLAAGAPTIGHFIALEDRT